MPAISPSPTLRDAWKNSRCSKQASALPVAPRFSTLSPFHHRDQPPLLLPLRKPPQAALQAGLRPDDERLPQRREREPHGSRMRGGADGDGTPSLPQCACVNNAPRNQSLSGFSSPSSKRNVTGFGSVLARATASFKLSPTFTRTNEPEASRTPFAPNGPHAIASAACADRQKTAREHSCKDADLIHVHVVL